MTARITGNNAPFHSVKRCVKFPVLDTDPDYPVSRRNLTLFVVQQPTSPLSETVSQKSV